VSLRLTIPKNSILSRLILSRPGKWILGSVVFLFLLVFGTFTYFWIHFSHIIDAQLGGNPFDATAMLYAAAEPVNVGDPMTPDELVAALKRRGYTTSQKNSAGWYNVRDDGVEIFPGSESAPEAEPAVIFINKGVVTRIVSNRDNTERPQITIEPELISSLFDRKRQKRRLVKFGDIPKVLVDAITSAEDKRFFQHSGFDPLRVVRAAVEDLRGGKISQGASTLTMQVARTFFLNRDRTWKRKASEVMLTLQLEHRLTKEEIFEHYVNYVDLGWRRSFAVQGFGEAAQVHFGKDIRELNLEESALLAGMAQGPNLYNPFRFPDKSIQRRNIVLSMMKENGYITESQFREASQAPLKLREGGIESSDAPYFVDLVYDDLVEQFPDNDFQTRGYKIYTTLDLKLQRDAVEAVRIGMAEVDGLLAKKKKKYPRAQVALVALDPHTGEIKALVGGRSYGESQLDRCLAKRQPGSIFKPFVYAAVLDTALQGAERPITPLTTVLDERTTFEYDGKTYEPGNFGEKYYGTVTMRQALSKSLNVPTVKFGEMAGFDRVVEVARAAGMNSAIKPTPAVALGSYVVTPIEIAGAYTAFSNEGVAMKPNWIREIRNENGGMIYETHPVKHEALDPRVSYMVVNLMEEVLRSGTGAGARSRGFGLPAAGKTGTSHDAWFAGFTSKLLCVVWVGFDDNQELPLEGAKAALPVWTEFMKRAHHYREYRGVQEFQAPDGIITVDIDPSTGMLATANCPESRAEVFLAGTQPVDLCTTHGGGTRQTMIAGWETPAPAEKSVKPGDPATPRVAARRPPEESRSPARSTETAKPPQQKKGFWGRIRDIFK